MSLISPEVASTAIPSPPPSKHRLFYDATTGKWASKNAAGAVTFFSGGDVVGPASAVNGNVVLFDTTTGKLLKDGGTLGTAAFTASTAYDASGAAAAAQAAAVQRANHTGTQLAATVSDFASAADARIALQRGAASGLAELDASGLVPTNRLPALAITSTYAVASEAAQLALVAQEGDVAIRSDINQSYIKNAGTAGTIADWSLLLTPTDAVLSVAGRTGAVVLAKADVGLGSVDNTSDLAKPVSTAQQAALDAKLDDTQASVFGLSLMDDADAATARTTLGLGTAATTAATDYATAAQGTDDRTASGIRTATGVVAVSTATAPAVGQTLVATSATAATWQTPASGSGSPAGTGTEMQYRAGPTTFGAMSGTAWDDTNRALTMTGATVTTSNPIQNLSQTWNAGAVAFTGWKFNATDTASAAGSLLFDYQVGGTSKITGRKDGKLTIGVGATGDPGLDFGGNGGISAYLGGLYFNTATTTAVAYMIDGCRVKLGGIFGWSSNPSFPNSSADTVMGRPAANSILFGGATGTAGAAESRTCMNKRVTALADATATTIFTVTIPNAAHSASIMVRLTGSLGAGGAIGANEATGSAEYLVTIARTSGVNAVATISSVGMASSASVAGGATITVTGTLGSVSGAVGASNTFTIQAAVARGSGLSANHTCLAYAELMNANASGVTIA